MVTKGNFFLATPNLLYRMSTFSQVAWHFHIKIKELRATATLTSVAVTIHVNIKWGEHIVLVGIVCFHQVQLGHKCLDAPRDAVLGRACHFLCLLH